MSHVQYILQVEETGENLMTCQNLLTRFITRCCVNWIQI